MNISGRFLALPLCLCLVALAPASLLLAQDPDTEPVRARHGMVVSIHHLATDAGVEVLQQGGNAVDAAVAVGFALAVVYPQAGNLGGGGFMLIQPGTHSGLGHGRPHFLDFREKAPAAAAANMYQDQNGNIIKGMSITGYKASGAPGTVAGLVYAEKHFGNLGLARVMAPAIRLAKDGYVFTDERELAAWKGKNLAQFPESHRIFQRNGNYYQVGERFVQPELAATLEHIAVNPGSFYYGMMAKQIADAMQAGGGLITEADMQHYVVKDRAPIVGHYRGYTVVTAPPPSSGGTVLVEILNILSGYNLAKLGADRSVAQTHIIIEAFRRAYMDRNNYLGDPDYNRIPVRQIISPAYAAAWRKSIDPVKPSPSDMLERPAGFLPDPNTVPLTHESPQTTHFSVMDKDGNAVAMTYTLNFTFGSGVTIPQLGFLMNDEMDDFTSKIGAPNGFGLIQGPANAIAPGKRPLSSMTPTILLKNGHVRYVLGTPGGSTITTTVANNVISAVDNGLDIQKAADAPRFHHQYQPDVLQVEKTFDRAVADELRKHGYTVGQQTEFDEKSPGTWGDCELIAVDPKAGELLGAHDSRRKFGKAAGY